MGFGMWALGFRVIVALLRIGGVGIQPSLDRSPAARD
jgi:hypothetical protein